jgi:hypothetical protein
VLLFSSVQAAPLPDVALLGPYTRIEGGFTDCYVTKTAGPVSLADYVAAFYTTPLFRMERRVLALAARSPSTDADAVALGAGGTDHFAVWSVEAHSDSQLLMCPVGSRTRSWFMVQPDGGFSMLYFGSAVVPVTGKDGLGFGFRALLGLHMVYSKALLASARRGLGA